MRGEEGERRRCGVMDRTGGAVIWREEGWGGRETERMRGGAEKWRRGGRWRGGEEEERRRGRRKESRGVGEERSTGGRGGEEKRSKVRDEGRREGDVGRRRG